MQQVASLAALAPTHEAAHAGPTPCSSYVRRVEGGWVRQFQYRRAAGDDNLDPAHPPPWEGLTADMILIMIPR